MWWILPLVAWGAKRPVSGSQTDDLRCPPGSALAGAHPPLGTEVWCARPVPGGAVREGPALSFYPDGAVRARGEYSEGQAHGRWTHLRPDGTVESTGEMVLGRRFGPWSTYWSNGQLSSRGAYVLVGHDGARHGRWELWSEDGARREVGEYVHGDAVGVWIEYGFDRPLRERTYRDGRLVAVREL